MDKQVLLQLVADGYLRQSSDCDFDGMASDMPVEICCTDDWLYIVIDRNFAFQTDYADIERDTHMLDVRGGDFNFRFNFQFGGEHR